MDEVDIDNVEDLNELEARLYAQIHHEATDVPIDEHIDNTQTSNNQQEEDSTNNSNNNTDIDPNYETSAHTNKVLSRRYWSSGENTLPQQPQHYQQNNKHRLIRNPFKTSDQVNPQETSDNTPSSLNKSENQTQLSKQMQIEATNDNVTLTTNENFKTKQDNTSKINPEIKNTDNIVKTSTATLSAACITQEDVTTTATTYKDNKKNKNIQSKGDQQRAKQNLETVPAIEKSNLKLNPVADWMKRNKQQLTKKPGNNIKGNGKSLQNNNSNSRNLKDGPFGQQQQKLQKAKRLEEKKQKSKKAKNTAKAIANKIKPAEIIDLDTDNESDNSDVILIPVAPPPTFTVEDSGDEDDKSNVPIILEHEENAIDSTDVQMSSTLSTFIKPQQILAQSSETVEGGDRRFENSSRCTSPCSIQSSDDFIGQNDRSRLLTSTSGMADDEDLLVLTSDINSLLEAPQSLKQNVDNENNSDKDANQEECAVEEPDQDKEASDSLNFAQPIISSVEKPTKDYRVDQTQFRALDVYESESDITDSVYSKGASKPTVIRQIDTSSDEVEDIGSSSQRTKRLRKRRASSSNKESDAGNDISIYSTDDDNEADDAADDDNKLLRTPIPFIARGPAVERCKPRKRSRTLSSCSPIVQKKKFTKSTVSPGHMSDTEFIATLNTLVQGPEEEEGEGDQHGGEDDESESENTPTARDIAEKILTKQHTRDENVNKSINDDIAVPEDILKDLDKVFDAIDKMDECNEDRNQYPTPNDAVNISDSDSDIEKRLVYKSTPYDHDTQIIAISPNYSKPDYAAPLKANKENGFPVYNVIYSRGLRKPGGLGWNDEMRKFYNDSWNGENFNLTKVLQKMNPDKNLWRIYTEDRFNTKSNRRHNNLKCTNCCEFGHMRSKCKRPRKPKICYMCGESGHNEPRCPNTICLRCGRKTQVFTKSCNSCTYQNRLTCPICKIRGHSLDYCPDKWRRYHSTTEPNVHPNNSINYNPRKYCCICGARGHLSDNCRSAVRFMEYPIIVSTVKSHQKSYGDIPLKIPHNGIGLNLMYEPCQEYNFDLVARTSLDKYYGRFLRAVGLEFLLRRNERQMSVNREVADTTAKRDVRFSKKYVANPYSKIGTANQQNIEAIQDAPQQVQEITESGNCTDDQTNDDEPIAVDEVINVDDNSVDNDTDMIGSTVNDDMDSIQLNTVNERPTAVEESGSEGNFKSPKNVSSTIELSTSTKSSTIQPPVVLDSDSNYSFSEHFDIPSKSVADIDGGADLPPAEESILLNSSRPKPRAMETLPDFIPLFDSSRDEINDNGKETSLSGISRRFVAAESDEEMECDESRVRDEPLPELPCEAKIYLTHVHSKYLLSPMGNAFLIKMSKSHKLKARLDFTSVGHVLVIFGLPSNQDKFQRELLLKYRELTEENHQKQCQNNLNVPKRADVLIRFLRDNITQLLNNLGNVNHLLKRLQFLERQQSKSGNKLAEKVRRSLNMILVGQAGLKDGTMHLDKLLRSLKTLINDYSNDEVTSPQLRSEITDHWKVIFSPYRHENYQQLVEAYNKLISKNRMPKLIIDPILLGQKVLDTSLTEEQKQKLEQPRLSVTVNEIADAEPGKQIVPNPLNEKSAKMTKRKHNASVPNTLFSPSSSVQPAANKVKTPTSRPVSPSKVLQNTLSRTDNSGSPINFKAKTTATSNCNPSGTSSTPLKTKIPGSTSTPIKTKTPNSTTSAANKSKTFGNPTTPTTTLSAKKQAQQAQRAMPPPPFVNPEKRSSVGNTIQKVSDKWKSTCDTLLMEISSDKPSLDKNANGGRLREAKLPSTFWSRESMRYLDDCVRLASARSEVLEKLKRVQNKSKNGQLSYNDYLAVIKLHTALCGK